jgi:OOP family OmpA-OmpF porin
MNSKATLLAGAAFLALTATAHASALRGSYASIEAGASWLEKERFYQQTTDTTSGSALHEYLASFDHGWAVFGSVGYGFESGIRVELELGYRKNEVTQITGTGSPWTPDGEMGEFTVMANALYDIDLTEDLSISLGGGVGADRAHFKVSCLCINASSWQLAYQGIAGINYRIGEQTQLFLNYRYLNVDAPDFSWSDGGPPVTTHTVGFLGNLNKHAVTLGLRFALAPVDLPDLPPPPPPAPEPQVPPPPPPAIPDQFVVFFGYNKANLSGEAMQVITDAARTAKETGSASIVIVGHTDSSGSDSYNEALSLRRAAAVKGALVGLGIEDAKITANGKGESELLVKTGDGVKEPQNRRATIDLN